MRFVRENCQMTNKKLYCEDVLQILFADSDSEREYLRFGNDYRLSNDHASPGKSLLRNGESIQKAQKVIISALCPTGMGVAGFDVFLVSIGEALRC